MLLDALSDDALELTLGQFSARDLARCSMVCHAFRDSHVPASALLLSRRLAASLAPTIARETPTSVGTLLGAPAETDLRRLNFLEQQAARVRSTIATGAFHTVCARYDGTPFSAGGHEVHGHKLVDACPVRRRRCGAGGPGAGGRQRRWRRHGPASGHRLPP